MPITIGSDRASAPSAIFARFRSKPLAQVIGGGAASGTAAATNLIRTNEIGRYGSPQFEHYVIGTQTITAPVLGVNGLNIAQDQANTEGCEISLGITALSQFASTVGIHRPKLSVKVKIEDASGAFFQIGFRKAEAYQVDWNDYDELVGIGVNGTADPNTIKLATIINNAATVVTDTTNTFADAAEKTFTVSVSRLGYVYYAIDGSQPTVLATIPFVFDAAEIIVPYIRFNHVADLAGTVELTDFACVLN